MRKPFDWILLDGQRLFYNMQAFSKGYTLVEEKVTAHKNSRTIDVVEITSRV